MSTTTDQEFCSARLSGKDAAAIGKELKRIERSAGELTPEAVLNAAKAKDSPLHEHFIWDNSAAAHQYRLVQAAWLIRAVKVRVVVNERPEEVRAFVHVVKEPDAAGSYVNINSALKRPDWRAQLLEQAVRDLEAFRRKYAVLTELKEVLSAIERVALKKHAA